MVLREEIKATITVSEDTVYNLTTDDFYNNISISSQCVNGNSIGFGSVASATFSASVKIAGVNRYSLIGAVVSVQIYKGSEWQQVGVYTITSATRNRDIITFSASDNMMLLDVSAFTEDENNNKLNLIYNFLSSEKTLYQLYEYVVTLADLEPGLTQEEFENMPNGAFTTYAYIKSENAYLRDWLSWIAEFVGGFAYADEYGRICVKRFQKYADKTVDISNSNINLDSLDIADYTTNAVKTQITGYDGSMYSVYNDNSNKTIIIDMSDNPIAQGFYFILNSYGFDSGTFDSLIFTFLGNLYSSIIATWVRPFTAQIHTDYLVQAGQSITIQDHDGAYYPTIITHHTWTMNAGQNIKCVGEDTRLLSDYKSRTSLKRVAEQLMSQVNIAKGINITQAEFDSLQTQNKLVEGAVYNIIG